MWEQFALTFEEVVMQWFDLVADQDTRLYGCVEWR